MNLKLTEHKKRRIRRIFKRAESEARLLWPDVKVVITGLNENKSETQKVIHHIYKALNLPYDMLSRQEEYLMPRHLIALWLKCNLDPGLNNIALAFEKKDHSTISNSIKIAQELIASKYRSHKLQKSCDELYQDISWAGNQYLSQNNLKMNIHESA